MELLKLPNVRLRKDVSINESQLYADAKQLAWEVATKNPLWTIVVSGHRTYVAMKDGEELGTFGMEWHGSNTKFFVRNDRIGTKNQNKNAYHTEDINKAVAKIKKTFHPMNLSERTSKALKLADKVLDKQRYHVLQRDNTHKHYIEGSMMEYARTQETQYILWLKQNNNLTMLDHIAKRQEAQADMKTINEVTTAFNDKSFALVIVEDGKYIVKVLDNVQLYDDTTLPHGLRGKLGMLKLVELEAMVTGIGCRVSDEIFVVVLEDVENVK